MPNSMLEQKIELAKKGRELWLSLVEKYSIGYDTVVYIMPHYDTECNGVALKYKERVLQSKRATQLIIIASEKSIGSINNIEGIKCEIITNDDMSALLKYNDMSEFSSQVIIISFEHGSDYDARKLCKTRGLSLDELIRVGLLNL